MYPIDDINCEAINDCNDLWQAVQPKRFVWHIGRTANRESARYCTFFRQAYQETIQGPSVEQPNTLTTTQSNDRLTGNTAQPSPGIKSLASYVLPNAWTEASCDSTANIVYVAPSGAVTCQSNPPAPVLLAIDPSNARDCNDLQNVQDVKKHTCISLFINGHKSLHSLTEYLPSSSYKQSTTIDAYYIDLGKSVLLAEYRYTNDNQYQADFDKLAKSVNAKP